MMVIGLKVVPLLVEHFDGSLELIDWNKKRKEIIDITTNGANKKLLRKTA